MRKIPLVFNEVPVLKRYTQDALPNPLVELYFDSMARNVNSEAAKAERDMFVYGTCASLDVKHIPIRNVLTDMASAIDQTAYWLADGDPVKSTWEKFFEKHKALFQKREKRLSDKNQAMIAADLNATGHEIHYRTCSCGQDFKFVDSFLCPNCSAAEKEHRRRISLENKLLRANGLEAFK